MYTDNQERIDAYLRGEMSGEERAKFEADLKSDSALHNDYIETEAISKALADRKKKLDMMNRWDQEEELRIKLQQRRKAKRNWAIGMSAAACIAVAFFAVRPLFQSDISSPAPTSGMPQYGDEAIYYRSGDSSMEHLDSLISIKRYETALAFVDSLIDDCNNELRQYAVKDILTEKEEANKETCEETLEDLEWRRSNLLVALGHNAEAKNYLRQIIEKEGYYSMPADSLLQKLENK